MLTDYMQLAIEQAQLGGPATYRNPQVGAVVVKDGHVIAQGYHHYFGGVHAEVDALQQLTPNQTHDATLVVTLEPCSHYGKTPPCCERIVAAGISKVVIGQLDPHSVVGGKGQAYLLAHGVEVVTGCLEARTSQLNPHYNCFYAQQRPWVTLKTAMTLDGKINDESLTRTLISNHESYVDSQQLRTQFHSLLIGEHTLMVDDPQLTVRLTALAQPPVRLVLLNTSTVAVDKQLVVNDDAETWLLCRQSAISDTALNDLAHVHVVVADWTPAMISALCVKQGWQSLLVEGGAHIQAAFIQADLVDEWISYLAPILLGGAALPAAFDAKFTSQQRQFNQPQLTRLGTDIRLRATRKVDA